MPIWINRATRRRHVDPNCRALSLSRELEAEFEQVGGAASDRIYMLSDDEPTDVITAVEAFTVPCRWCVPGARELGKLMPFYFVTEGYEEEYDEKAEE